MSAGGSVEVEREFEVKYRSPDQIRSRRGRRRTTRRTTSLRRSPVDDRGVRGPPRQPDGGQPPHSHQQSQQRRRVYPPLPGGPPPASAHQASQTAREEEGSIRRAQALLSRCNPAPSRFRRAASRPRSRAATAATAARRGLRQRRSAAPQPGAGIGAGIAAGRTARWTAAGAGRRRSGRRRRSRAVATGPHHGSEGPVPGGNGLCAFFNTPGMRVGGGVRVQAREGTRAAARSVSQSKVLNDERATPEVSHRIATGARVVGVHLERYETSGHLVSKRRLQRRADRAGDE